MKNYLFYDLETSGLNKSFDQILQFAAIRTDPDLNEIDRYSINVRLRPDVIPSPYASITHRISIAESEKGVSECVAVRHIHALLNTPGTVSLGYNTLGFDDEFLRFSFYRNLLSPYTHQYAGACSRSDILPFSVLYFLYKPETLIWPVVEGKSSLKLEHLSDKNDLAKGRAHDAIVDVEATVELARRFSREKDMWNYILGYFDKRMDKKRIYDLPSAFESAAGMHMYGLMTGVKFGAENLYQAPVLYIGDSIPYSNQSLWLRLDLPELREVDLDNPGENSRVLRKRFGESPIILPPVERFASKISAERMAIVQENLHWLKTEKETFYKLINYYREFEYTDIPGVDVDGALYINGFMSKEEQALCNRFNQSSHDGMEEIINLLPEGHLKELAERVYFRNFFDEVSGDAYKAFEEYLKAVNPKSHDDALIDFRGGKKTTPVSALQDIKEIRKEIELDEEQSMLINEIENYIKGRFGADV